MFVDVDEKILVTLGDDPSMFLHKNEAFGTCLCDVKAVD